MSLSCWRPVCRRPAWADDCAALFAGGQAPVLLNAKLAPRTTMLCNEAFAVLASGVTRGPLWSAEYLTAQGVADAEVTARTGRFHEEERLPPEDRALLSDDYPLRSDHSGYTAPSGDMPNPDAQQQSFSLANTVPQIANVEPKRLGRHRECRAPPGTPSGARCSWSPGQRSKVNSCKPCRGGC